MNESHVSKHLKSASHIKALDDRNIFLHIHQTTLAQQSHFSTEPNQQEDFSMNLDEFKTPQPAIDCTMADPSHEENRDFEEDSDVGFGSQYSESSGKAPSVDWDDYVLQHLDKSPARNELSHPNNFPKKAVKVSLDIWSPFKSEEVSLQSLFFINLMIILLTF